MMFQTIKKMKMFYEIRNALLDIEETQDSFW